MGLGSFFRSASRLFKTISKPDWKTYSLSIKIVFIGVALLGSIGFLVRLIAVTLTRTPT